MWGAIGAAVAGGFINNHFAKQRHQNQSNQNFADMQRLVNNTPLTWHEVAGTGFGSSSAPGVDSGLSASAAAFTLYLNRIYV